MNTLSKWIIFVFAAIGFLTVFFGAGGIEHNLIGLAWGICISLAGLAVIVAVIYYCNRDKKFPLTFSDNLKILRKRGF